MISDVSIGQFFPGGTLIHRLDPRVKLISAMLFIIVIFFAKNVASAALVVFFTFSLMLMTKIPLRLYFKGLKAIWILILFTAVINMFYVDGTVLLQWKFIRITSQGLIQSGFIAVRLISLILISSVLSFTTSPTSLTDAIESILSPLSKLGLKVHELSMMMSIALRFVPTLLEETEKIMNAQKARGADMESGNLIKRVKALIPILIPLFISSIRRAFDLAVAMECRCYNGGAGKTRMKQLRVTGRDYVALFAVFAVSAAIIGLNFVFKPLI